MTDALATESGVTVENFEGKIETAYGQSLPSPLSYTGSYEKVMSYDAIPPKELPDKEDVLALVNNSRKANARQKAMQTALDNAGIKKPEVGASPEGKLVAAKIIASTLVKTGMSEEQAMQIAKAQLGL